MNAKDIIAKAICDKPDEFRAAMIDQAAMHDDYATISAQRFAQAAKSAEFQKATCLNIYDAISRGDIDAIVNLVAPCVIALNAACKLLDIGPAQRTSAIVEWSEIQKKAGLWPI